MDCKRIEAELVAFELSAIDGATRAAVETHLVGCARCVGQYLALKRAVDAADEAGEPPSEMLRARLRRDVDAKVRTPAPALMTNAPATTSPMTNAPVTKAPATISRMTKAPALANAALANAATSAPARMMRESRRRARVAVGVAALAAAMIAPFAWQHSRPQPSSHGAPALHAPPPRYDEPLVPVEEVDTARTTPENLRFL